MRTTTTTKSVTIALAITAMLAVPSFAARDDAKRQTRQEQQQQTLVQRIVKRLKHVFDLPGIPIPGTTTTTP